MCAKTKLNHKLGVESMGWGWKVVYGEREWSTVLIQWSGVAFSTLFNVQLYKSCKPFTSQVPLGIVHLLQSGPALAGHGWCVKKKSDSDFVMICLLLRQVVQCDLVDVCFSSAFDDGLAQVYCLNSFIVLCCCHNISVSAVKLPVLWSLWLM
jgi:hypothetical protein